MRYYRVADGEVTRLVARDKTRAYDITAVEEDVETLCDLAKKAKTVGESIDGIALRLIDERFSMDPQEVINNAKKPIVPDEIWAAGVTYEISEQARQTESDMPEVYLDVYNAERPELFFKATNERTVGPGEPVGIRADSGWNVPEPEMGVVLYDGQIIGYTIGNDMSSREIEGQNPLYLPQAKMYNRCCSIGPCVSSPNTVVDPHDLSMEMRIVRDGDCVYDGSTSTANLVRTCEELVSFLTRHNTLPEMVVLLTGTSLVPNDDFTLSPDDRIKIEVEDIGELINTVVTV